MADFTDETLPPTKGTPIFLGVIGSRQDCTQSKIVETLMIPILEELGRVPDRVILPSEGTSSIYISDWAESLKVPTQIYEADWKMHQRRAKIFRDSRIQNESTHFIVFLNKRSEFNGKLANRLAKKGHTVFTVNFSDWSIESLIVEEPSSQPLSLRQEERESKRGTGKEPKCSRAKQSEFPESQCLLTDLWAT